MAVAADRTIIKVLSRGSRDTAPPDFSSLFFWPRIIFVLLLTNFWPRIVFILLLTAAAYFPIFLDVVKNAADGSGTAYLVVVPVLAMIVAYRYHDTPHGVGDAETDWITAILIGAAGFVVIWLVTDRFPTTATMWKLHLVAVGVWLACSTTVMFGLRYASRMGLLWLFIAVSAAPLPYLLVTAYFGGSDLASALLAAAWGAVAVFLSGRATMLRWRLSASVGCMAVAAVATLALRGTTLLLTVAIVAGVIPILSVIVLFLFNDTMGRQHHSRETIHFARRSWVSYATLLAIAVLVLFINASRENVTEPLAFRPDWVQRAGLTTSQGFPFISRFVAPGATLTRYPVAPAEGFPAAAVDVIATSRTGALRDYADAIWYPTNQPVVFAATELGGPLRVKARVMHSNADATTDGDNVDWYALTWLWRDAAVTQQVTVIVTQPGSDHRPPPEPRPMSVMNQVVVPLLWIPGQQWIGAGVVDESVVQRAEAVAGRLLSAGVVSP